MLLPHTDFETFSGGGSTTSNIAATSSGGGLTGVLNSVTSISGAANAVLSLPVFSNTLGSVFANGFDLSCWNSSSSPAEAKTWAQNSLFPFFTNKLKAVQNSVISKNLVNASTLSTKLSEDLKSIEEHQLFHLTQVKASCSKKGNTLKAQAASQLSSELNQYFQDLSSTYDVKISEVVSDVTKPRPTGIEINWKGRSNIMKPHAVYSIKDKVVPIINAPLSSIKNAASYAGMSTIFLIMFVIGVVYWLFRLIASMFKPRSKYGNKSYRNKSKKYRK